jgi:type II secretory pathway component GspD/PulD (secretin)
MTRKRLGMALLSLLMITALAVAVYAQAPTIEVPVEGMKVVRVGSSIDRVVVGTSGLVRAKVVTGQQIMLFGVSPGSTTLHVWTEAGLRKYNLQIANMAGDQPGEDMGSLLEQLGEENEQGNVMRVYTPEYRDITQFRQYITQLLGDRGEIVLSDGSSGKVFVLGPPKLLDKIETLLDQIDVPGEDERYTRRIVLQNRSASSISEKVQEMLSDDGKVVVDEETNSLLVVDNVGKVKQIHSYLDEIDVPTVSQVKITARFVELTDEASRQIGINWAARGLSEGDRIDGGFGQNPRVGTVSDNTDEDGNPIPGLQVGDIQGIQNFQIGFNDISGAGIDARLQALETEGLAKTISSPTVLTRNQQKATLEILNQQTYVAGFETNQVDGAQSTVPEIETVEDGITLGVTPLIGNNNVVQLEVKPTLKLAQLGDPRTVDGRSFFTPAVDQRSADLSVALRDGQTLVIGGLNSTESSNNDNKVPLLGDIPILGYAFKSSSKASTDRDITIFLTAEIVPLFPGSNDGDTPVSTADTGAQSASTVVDTDPDTTPVKTDFLLD